MHLKYMFCNVNELKYQSLIQVGLFQEVNPDMPLQVLCFLDGRSL